MKKFAKMSLVAAVAVAGMVSTSSAKDLSEAIKGVDVSGSIVYRYEDYEDNVIKDDDTTGTVDEGNSARNRYKAAISFKAPVNDDVTANTRLLAASDSGSFVDLGTSTTGDSNVDVKLSQVNFTYTGISNTSVSFGKLGVTTPWTNGIDADGSEQTGTGIIAATTVGPVTGVAGFLNQTNFSSEEDVIVAGLLGSMGPVNAEAWYINIDDTEDAVAGDADTTNETTGDTIFVKIGAKFNVSDIALSVYAQHSETDSDDLSDSSKDDLYLTKAGISAKMGVFNAGVTYAAVGDDGAGLASANSLSKASVVGWNQTVAKKEDASMVLVDLGMQVLPELHVGLNYDAISEDATGGADSEETFVQATYKMSKNFMTYVRFGEYDKDGASSGEDGTRGRLHVQYTF